MEVIGLTGYFCVDVLGGGSDRFHWLFLCVLGGGGDSSGSIWQCTESAT